MKTKNWADDFRPADIMVPLPEPEARLLYQLLGELRQLVSAPPASDDPLERLEAEAKAARLDQTDPVVARLFPSAYTDAELDAEYHRLSEGNLRAEREADAALVARELARADQSGTYLRVNLADQLAWLRTINSLRLALTARWGVATAQDQAKLDALEEAVDAAGESDPRYESLQLYYWLSYLLEAILEAID